MKKITIGLVKTREVIIVVILLIGLVITSTIIGYLIGVINREECPINVLVSVEVEDINSMLFADIFVWVLPFEQNYSVDDLNETGTPPNDILWTYQYVNVSYEGNTLYISAVNATILKVEIIITEIFYYFRIVDWFYTYIKYDLNTTNFTLSHLDFWRLITIR